VLLLPLSFFEQELNPTANKIIEIRDSDNDLRFFESEIVFIVICYNSFTIIFSKCEPKSIFFIPLIE